MKALRLIRESLCLYVRQVLRFVFGTDLECVLRWRRSRHKLGYSTEKKMKVFTWLAAIFRNHCKGKGHPVTCYEGPEGEQRYSSTHSKPRLCMGWRSTSCPSRFTRGKEPQCPRYRRLIGTRGRSGRKWRRANPVPHEVFEPRTVQPTASCYTDYSRKMKIILKLIWYAVYLDLINLPPVRVQW